MLKDALTLSALIAAVLLVRAAFKNRVPKRLLYALWLVVLLKLCLPGTAYALPLLPAEQTAAAQQTETPAQSAPAAQQPTQAAAQPQTPAQQPASQPQEAAKPAAAMPLVTEPVLVIWFCGSALLGLWLLLTWLVFTVRLRRSRRCSPSSLGNCSPWARYSGISASRAPLRAWSCSSRLMALPPLPASPPRAPDRCGSSSHSGDSGSRRSPGGFPR